MPPTRRSRSPDRRPQNQPGSRKPPGAVAEPALRESPHRSPAVRGSGEPAPPRPRIIGLTGGIASGKSTVAAMLERRGAVVVDSDRVAREVVEPGTPGLAAIVAAFGPQYVGPDGRLDRRGLGATVFRDPAARRRLEAITHPLIGTRSAELVAQAAGAGAPLIVVDVPLLFEVGREGDFPDGVLLVYADPGTQVRRLRERERLDEAAAAQRLAAQLPIDRKRRLATWVIDNGGSRQATAAQVARWWRETVG